MDKFQLYIRNKSSNPYKIPFVRSAAYDQKAKVDGVILVGGKAIVPSGVAGLVDMERLEQDKKRGIVKYRVKKVKTMARAGEK